MKEIEKYLFDLQGYIVLEGVLSEAEVARANEAVDRHADRIRERTGELSLSGDSAALKGITGRGDLGGLPASSPASTSSSALDGASTTTVA